MKSFLKKITFIIVSFDSEKIIKKCLKKLPNCSQIIIVENSNDKKIKKIFSKKKNVNVILSTKNNGFGHGNNIGIGLTRTPYALMISPDVFLRKQIFEKIRLSLKKIKNDFWLLGLENITKNKNLLSRTPYIGGHAILVNLKKFKNKKIFDENYFLYNEEIDLCKNVEKKNGKIYSLDSNDIVHLGKMSSGKDDFKMQVFRNWHGYWSYVYYYKKNYGTFKAYSLFVKKFLSSFGQYLFNVMLLNRKKRIMNRFKMQGLIVSLFNKPSYLRLKDLKF